MRTPARRIIGGVGAVATGAAATALTIATRQQRGRDRHKGEPIGRLKPDFECTVSADDGVTLHVEEIYPADSGEADVTLIGVHGFAMSLASWHFQRRDLAALTLPRVRQVYFDMRGHGRSGRVTGDKATAEELASDLHAVIRAMAPRGRIVLLGHSLGGLAIMALAELDHALFERVAGVAFISSSAGDVTKGGLPRTMLSRFSPVGWGVGGITGLTGWQPELGELVRAVGGQLTRPAVKRVLFGSTGPGSTVLQFVLDQLDDTSVKELLKFANAIEGHHRYTALVRMRRSVVVVIAGAADRVLPFSHAERIAAELPDAKLVRLEGAGHMPQLETPEVVTSQLIDLLQRCCDVESGGVRDVALRKMLRRWFP